MKAEEEEAATTAAKNNEKQWLDGGICIRNNGNAVQKAPATCTISLNTIFICFAKYCYYKSW